MKFLLPVFRFLFFLFELMSDLVVLYFLFALAGALLPRDVNESKNETGIPLLIHGDGFHTELYLPVQDSLGIINWMDWFDDSTIRNKHSGSSLINFAWAEYDWTMAGVQQKPKGIQTTLEIFFWPRNKSLMHVQWMNEPWPLEHATTIKRYLSREQYQRLIAFLKSGFELTGEKQMIASYKGYYGFDYLYKSNRYYNCFNTCNQFTSDALHACGIRNAVFSPFGWGVFYQLKKDPH